MWQSSWLRIQGSMELTLRHELKMRVKEESGRFPLAVQP